MLRTISSTNRSLRSLTPGNCNVSTMTLCGTLDSVVRISAIAKSMEKHATLETHGLAFPGASKKSKGTTTFQNQLTIKSGTTSIKLFSNGAIQVTGAKSPIHFLDVMDRVCSALGAVQDATPTLSSASISMINAIFSTARVLPLRVLRQAFEAAGHDASYDPDSYPGVNAKICTTEKHRVTVMIFTTGSVIISGAKTPENVSEVYGIVCGLIDALPDAAKVQAPKTKPFSAKLVDAYGIIGGYPARIANLCNWIG